MFRKQFNHSRIGFSFFRSFDCSHPIHIRRNFFHALAFCFCCYLNLNKFHLSSFTGMIRIARRYAKTPGKKPVKMTTRSQIRRISTGSTLEYSPNPPQIPAKTLSVLLLYSLFCSIELELILRLPFLIHSTAG